MAGPRHEAIPLEDRSAWEGPLRAIPHSFHHTWDFAYAAHLTTGYRTCLYRFSHRRGVLLCPLVERPFEGRLDVSSPSGLAGFIGDLRWSQFAPHWRDYVREKGWVTGYIGLHPLFKPPEFAQRAQRHNSVYVLDLTLGLDALKERMDQNRRRELRGWESRAEGFVVDRDAISRFVQANYGPLMRRVGAHGTPFAPDTLDVLCRNERAVCVGAASSDGLEAVNVFCVTRHAAEFLINVATLAGRRHTTDLLWYGVRELSDRGVRVLNLGGGGREDDSIARAKRRLRPRRLPLLAMREVYRPGAYAELCRSVGADPGQKTGYFPAYRAQGLERARKPA